MNPGISLFLSQQAWKAYNRHDSLLLLPSYDNNNWYYPSQGHDSDEDDLSYGISRGNWGKKKAHAARWVRTGKLAAWGPGIEDWEVCNYQDLDISH
jgi:hypothetical protein